MKPVDAARRNGSVARAERQVFKYEVEADGVAYEICQKAFLSILDMKRSKLRKKITGGRGPVSATLHKLQ